ncbi:RTA1 domain-containing protein [Colletotrichum asianum]
MTNENHQNAFRCDEGKPHCQTCIRPNIPCAGYQTGFKFQEDPQPVRLKARRQAKRGAPVNSRQSGTSASPGSLSATPEEELRAEGYDEKWLRAHFPSQLPRIFRDISQGVGCDSVAYRAAVYALAHVPVEFGSDAPNEKQLTALKFYHLSLQDIAKGFPVEDADHMALSLAILSVLSIVEMKLGTYLGGLTHAKQADALIADDMGSLSSSLTGRQVVAAWFPIKAWYSVQCVPWDNLARVLPSDALGQSWDLLRSSDDKSHELAALLVESRRLYALVSLHRLLKTTSSKDDISSWTDLYQTVVKKCSSGLSKSEEASCRTEVAGLRDMVDAWHDSIPLEDRPIYGATSRLKKQLASQPPGTRIEPLTFRSYRAAMNYARYAAAQALSSDEALDIVTGATSLPTAYRDEWNHIILQIIAGLEKVPCTGDDDNYLGLMWIVGQVVGLRCLDPSIISWIESHLELLASASHDWGSFMPKDLFGPLLALQRGLLERGRVAVHIFGDMGPSIELSEARSPAAKRSVLVLVTAARNMSATLSASTLVVTPSPTETTAAACISIAPDSNGHVPYGACQGFWPYVPSFEGNLALAILFGLSTLVHLVQAVMYKQRYCWVIIMAGVWETSAFVLRTLGAKNGRVLPFYIISSLTFMLAPLWINAYAYMVGARIVHFSLPDRRVFRVKASYTTKLFVGADLVCFGVQGAGGSMLSGQGSASTMQTGKVLYTAGCIVQLIFIAIFTAVVVQLHVKIRKNPPSAWNANSLQLIWVIFIVLVLIFVRLIFRLVEFGPGGMNETIMTAEVYAICLDAVPMAVALAILNVFHPGRMLSQTAFDRVIMEESEMGNIPRRQGRYKELEQADRNGSVSPLPKGCFP